MKSQRTSHATFVFFIGIAIGIAITFLVAEFLSYIDSGTLLTQSPKTFGDIRIWVQKPKVAEDTEVPKGIYREHAKELWMTKDDIPFLMISQNETGKINGLYLVKNNYRPVFWMEPLASPGKWGNATYSAVRLTDKPVGDVFKDIDFDGRFDFRLTLAANGPASSRSIFIDGSWQKVDHYSVKEKKARIGETIYTFDPNFGWQEEQ